MEVNPKANPDLLLMLLFFGHFRCPLERREGIAKTEETAETCA